MTMWTIEPRDPLVVRDGRPNNGRSESGSLPFPYPGTIAGIVRTRLGSDARGVFDPRQDLDSLRRAAIRGPVLASVEEGRLYVPRPRDALVFRPATGPSALRRLVPVEPPAGAVLDNVPGAPPCVAGLSSRATGKGAPVPAWWPWEAFERWLAVPQAMEGRDAGEALPGAFSGLPAEGRLHLKVSETWTAQDGMLFQVRGLRFGIREKAKERRALALAFELEAAAAGNRTLREGIGPCGGKRRLARWHRSEGLRLPGLCAEVRAALSVKDPIVRVRVVLLTPAVFQQGWRPGDRPGENQLLAARDGVVPSLVAACVPRAETISGWDFEKRWPKATRRLVSSGSVYWIDLEGSAEGRVRWAEEVMMQNVSDAEQDRRDGFGLAAVGVGT